MAFFVQAGSFAARDGTLSNLLIRPEVQCCQIDLVKAIQQVMTLAGFCVWAFPTVDGRNPAPPKKPWNDSIPLQNTNQWFPMNLVRTAFASIHPSGFKSSALRTSGRGAGVAVSAGGSRLLGQQAVPQGRAEKSATGECHVPFCNLRKWQL